MGIQEVMDRLGEITRVMCTGSWSRDRGGIPCLDWWITLPCGDTYKAALPVFTDWWEVSTVALHKLEWGQEFDYEGSIYTLDRGNGMYPWVVDQNGQRFAMYMGEQVTPL